VSHRPTASLKPLPVFDLGLAPYAQTTALQGRLREAVAEGRLAGVLLLLEHPAIITLGSRGRLEDLRPAPGLPPVEVVRTERGGQATLHAPGQLVSYPIVSLPGRDLRRFVRGLEQVLIAVLGRQGVKAERREGRPGLYVPVGSGEVRKIASVGLRCHRWVASHGTSLNVSLDLRLFELIVSCGEAGLRQTSVLELTGLAPSLTALKEDYRKAFAQHFGLRLEPLRRLPPGSVETALGLS